MESHSICECWTDLGLDKSPHVSEESHQNPHSFISVFVVRKRFL